MSESFKVLTIGDAMITMNPLSTGPLRYVTTFERKIGGAELNFAIGCARLGLESRWISRLGNDEFGRVIFNFARGEGIDVSEVQMVNNYPTSVNFKEIRDDGGGKTFYYRHPSPICTLQTDDIKPTLLEDVDLLHLTGVFLAIDPCNLPIVQKLIAIAKDRNIPISFDPNIRLRLWSIEEARNSFEHVLNHTDILLAGLNEINLLTNQHTKEGLASIAKKYNIRDLVIKDGAKGSMLFRDNQWHSVQAFKVNAIDTVGAGDGFDAGYVYGYLHRLSPEKLLQFANGVGALVTTVSGDNEGLPYLDEVEAFINNDPLIDR